MADEPATAPLPTNPAEPTQPAPAAAPQNTEPAPKSWEDAFNHPRFRELAQQAKEAQAKLDSFEKAEAQRKQAELEAQGKHEELIAQLRPQAERAKALEETLSATVNAMIEEIPEDKRSLIPDIPVDQKLAYINANRHLLVGNKPKTVGASTSPSTDGSDVTPVTEFTKAQINNREFYKKHEAEIKKAIVEGRIKD